MYTYIYICSIGDPETFVPETSDFSRYGTCLFGELVSTTIKGPDGGRSGNTTVLKDYAGVPTSLLEVLNKDKDGNLLKTPLVEIHSLTILNPRNSTSRGEVTNPPVFYLYF